MPSARFLTMPSCFGARSMILLDAGQAQEAEMSARTAIELDATLPHLHAQLSVALERQDRVEEAIAAARGGLAARRDVATRPDSAWLHAHLGRLLLQVGELDGAEAELAWALRYDPDIHDAADALQEVRAQIEERGVSART